MTDRLHELDNEYRAKSRASYDCAECAADASAIEWAKSEIERLRSQAPVVKAKPLEWVADHGEAMLGPYRLFQADTPLGKFAYGTDAEGSPYWQSNRNGIFMVGEEATAKRLAEASWSAMALEEISKFATLEAPAPSPSVREDFASDYIDQLNALCEDFGCEPGTDRLHWLHEQLSKLSPAHGAVEALRENVLEDAAKSAFVKAQSVYRSDHDHFPLKSTWETTAESVREGWRSIAYAALEAAHMPPLGTQPEPRKPRDAASAVAALAQPAAQEGWRLVPVKPTEEMIGAGDEVMYGRYGCSFEVSPIYKAMLAAAPSKGVE